MYFTRRNKQTKKQQQQQEKRKEKRYPYLLELDRCDIILSKIFLTYSLGKTKTSVSSYTNLARYIFANVSILLFINRHVTFTSAFFFADRDLMLLELFLSKLIKVLYFSRSDLLQLI